MKNNIFEANLISSALIVRSPPFKLNFYQLSLLKWMQKSLGTPENRGRGTTLIHSVVPLPPFSGVKSISPFVAQWPHHDFFYH